MIKRLAGLFVALLSSAAPAAGLDQLAPSASSQVVEVIDGDTVMLDDGREVRLVGLQAPKLPLGRKNFPTWPLAPEAKAALESLLLGQLVEPRYGPTRMDRHGRHLAHLFRQDGLWAQGEMLRRGFARVYTFPDNRMGAAEMLAAEAEARQAGRGIWALDHYRPVLATDLKALDDGFQIVRGTVVDAAKVGGTIYLNFGQDYRSDFTIVIDRAAARLFTAAKIDPLTLKGREVEVRGWLQSRNGPMIQATHPEQILRLD